MTRAPEFIIEQAALLPKLLSGEVRVGAVHE
jgi:hypothetical protein